MVHVCSSIMKQPFSFFLIISNHVSADDDKAAMLQSRSAWYLASAIKCIKKFYMERRSHKKDILIPNT